MIVSAEQVYNIKQQHLRTVITHFILSNLPVPFLPSMKEDIYIIKLYLGKVFRNLLWKVLLQFPQTLQFRKVHSGQIFKQKLRIWKKSKTLLFAETIFSLAKVVICILKNEFRGAHVLLGSKWSHILTQHLSTWDMHWSTLSFGEVPILSWEHYSFPYFLPPLPQNFQIKPVFLKEKVRTEAKR